MGLSDADLAVNKTESVKFQDFYEGFIKKFLKEHKDDSEDIKHVRKIAEKEMGYLKNSMDEIDEVKKIVRGKAVPPDKNEKCIKHLDEAAKMIHMIRGKNRKFKKYAREMEQDFKDYISVLRAYRIMPETAEGKEFWHYVNDFGENLFHLQKEGLWFEEEKVWDKLDQEIKDVIDKFTFPINLDIARPLLTKLSAHLILVRDMLRDVISYADMAKKNKLKP